MLKHFTIVIAVVALMLSGMANTANASEAAEKKHPILERVFSYKDSVEVNTGESHSNIYIRYNLRIGRRNFGLMFIPSMYVVSRGRREYAGETYTRVDIQNNKITGSQRHLNVGTIPRNRSAMPSVMQYMVPNMYDVTIVEDHILSPFNRENQRYYSYKITPLTDNRVEIAFMPKMWNTQLISGEAITDAATGRLISIDFHGEYDMIMMHIRMDMGDSGIASLYPKNADLATSFSFLGNKITGGYHTVYGIDKPMPDSVVNVHDRAAMDTVRPEPLPLLEAGIYARYDAMKAAADSSSDAKKEQSKWKTILWDIIGDNLINRIHSNFGPQDKGYFRLSPILNPLYLDYSKNRGISYKFKVRARYDFTANSNITLYFKGGYSFKLKEFYYRIPLRYTFNNRRNGYIEIEIGNGHRITTNDVVDKIKDTKADSINWKELNLDYFKREYVKLVINYDISDKLTVQPGMIYHHHTAVDKEDFITAGRPYEYKTFAPTLELQYRPRGWDGIALTADYERGLKGVGSTSTDYEKIELDASWLNNISSVRSLSLRAGCGFYTSRSKNSYFLDYTNFREDNLSDGWNDDWTGNFQLLDRNWYNASEYYVRANATYESPLMIMSRIPYVGRFIETERIYVSALWVEHLHPYIEYGYGFTNRIFSIGLFCATRNAAFDSVGARFAFELFNDW